MALCTGFMAALCCCMCAGDPSPRTGGLREALARPAGERWDVYDELALARPAGERWDVYGEL